MTERYAVYLAPPPDTALWRFGSRVIGYDAATGSMVPAIALPDVSEQDWHRITASPRLYGFHATLKAPFSLAEGKSPGDLRDAMQRLCGKHAAFDLGPLTVSVMPAAEGGFVALTQQRPSIELSALEKSVVSNLDELRAPLTEADLKRRNPEFLSERQRSYLSTWGYPFVMEEYRFHMTLTGWLSGPATVADSLAEVYAAEGGSQHMVVDALVLFVQPAPGEAFRIVERYPFRA